MSFAIAALSLLAFQAGEGLSFETPKGWERKEDAKLKQTLLLPPDLPKGKECVIIIFQAQEFEGTSQAYLDRLVENATKGNEIQGKVQFLELGGFRVAWIVQKLPAGALQFVTIHAARWEKKAQAAIFAANDYEILKTHTPAAQAMFQKVAIPGGAGGAGLDMPLPAGWTKQNDPGGWTVVTPPAEMGTTTKLFIGTRKIEGSHWNAHRALLQNLVQEAKWKGSWPTAALASPGPFIASEVNSTADISVIRLYTALSANDQMEVVAVTPDCRGAFGPALMSILERTKVRNPAPASKRPQVVEAWRRPAMKKFINSDGSIFYTGVKYDRVVLFSDGLADFSQCHAEGMAACPDVLKSDAGRMDGSYGSWKADGNSIRIRRKPDQAEEVWERENGMLKVGDQMWWPMPKLDGLRLKGRYATKSDPANNDLQYNYWVDFAEDGTFKTGGLLTWLAGGDSTGRPKPPETASGTYEIRDWTLWFKVDGAIVWSTDITTLKEDPKDLETLLFQTFALRRE